MGGEKLVQQLHGVHGQGSPPRGRGKATINQLRQAFAGITPAWAGKSLLTTLRTWSPRDHPRVGGEKQHLGVKSVPDPGSPPRGRGKESPSSSGSPVPGITPAWAGKSFLAGHRLRLAEDHPRVGGEKLTPDLQRWRELGSPPRGRGKAFHSFPQPVRLGITPAWAGKRRLAANLTGPGPAGARPWPPQDHPRVGGEKTRYAMKVPPW